VTEGTAGTESLNPGPTSTRCGRRTHRWSWRAAVGFGWSEDGGKSWSWNTEGLHDSYLRAVCLDGETAYVSASDGPFTKRAAVYRARLGSAFVRCEEGLSEWFPHNVDTGHLDAAGGRAVIGFGEEVRDLGAHLLRGLGTPPRSVLGEASGARS
jgi:hypothetical protein